MPCLYLVSLVYSRDTSSFFYNNSRQECIPVGCVPSAMHPLPRTPPCHAQPLVNRMTDRRLWKHYLSATTVANGKDFLFINLCCRYLRHRILIFQEDWINITAIAGFRTQSLWETICDVKLLTGWRNVLPGIMILPLIITARQRSCGNVVFSEACICLSTRGRGIPMWSLLIMHRTSLYQASHLQTWDMGPLAPTPSPLVLAPQTWDTGSTNPSPAPLLVASSGHHWRPDQTYSVDLTLQDPPAILTSSGHQSTYGWFVDSTQPTGMLSCWGSFQIWNFS